MKRIMLTIAYDGTNYNGWQSGGIGISIEETINSAIKKLTGEDVKIIGTSRTDSGVHAKGNIAVFDTESKIDSNIFHLALNNLLPLDIRIFESKEVDVNFHPRKVPSKKIYKYKILNQKISDPINRLYSYFVYHKIDIEKMTEGAQYLVGQNDFKSFVNPRSNIIQINKLFANKNDLLEEKNVDVIDDLKHSTIRTIYDITIENNEDNVIIFTFEGNGFLYHQIRIMVGSLLRVGMNMWEPISIKEILEKKDRKYAGPTAPACGLLLEKIIFV